MEHNDRLCCVCGKPTGQEDIVLSGLGGEHPNDAILAVHIESCANTFLRYLKEHTWRRDNA